MRLLLGFMLIMLAGPVIAQGDAGQSVDSELQDLKKDVMQLNRDLFILEEELLYPSSTQLTVFLSMDVGEYFALDAVELKIDDQVVTHYLYTQRELSALRRGGVQRLYLGNVRSGDHELTAFFIGLGPKGREYRRATSLKFSKDRTVKYLELRISDLESKQQPEFGVREW